VFVTEVVECLDSTRVRKRIERNPEGKHRKATPEAADRKFEEDAILSSPGRKMSRMVQNARSDPVVLPLNRSPSEDVFPDLFYLGG